MKVWKKSDNSECVKVSRGGETTIITRHTSTITRVSLRFFMHMARARLRLVVLNVTDWMQKRVEKKLTLVSK